MIFVTVGTNEQPFDRLVRAAAPLAAGEELLVQHGSCTPLPAAGGDWQAFLTFDEMTAAMRRARVVIAHAGVGSILLARACGRRAVVLPRRGDLGEAVDDHQLALARRLAAAGYVTVVHDAAELRAAVAAAPTDPTLAATAPSRLPGELRAYLSARLASAATHPEFPQSG